MMLRSASKFWNYGEVWKRELKMFYVSSVKMIFPRSAKINFASVFKN